MTDLPKITLPGGAKLPPVTSHGHIITGFKQLDLILNSDISWYLHILENPTPEEQLLRRALVRAIFAEIEAETYLMKQKALSRDGQPGVSFKPKDLAKLKDEKYDPAAQPRAKADKNYMKFADNIKFAFKKLAFAYSKNYTLDVENQGWNSLTKSIEVRDRLVHPKKVEDLTVSDAELARVKEAHNWFSTTVPSHPAAIYLSQ